MLTERQHRLLTYLYECQVKTGISPSYQQMADAIGSEQKGNAHALVARLIARGYVRRLENKQLEVVKKPSVGFFVFDNEKKCLRPARGSGAGR